DAAVAEAAARALAPADLERTDLRGPEADMAASAVAVIPGVRAALLDWQRDFGRRHGAVLDGRDIGTVIFPDAPAKLFVTASAEARATRRWLELQGKGVARDLADVAAELAARDAQDASRSAAPMKPAADAIILDTTDLDAEHAFQMALKLVRSRLG
uniref:(d)CMP kinase n=1 Tax=Falsiroseomonas oryziterrae TaxID=2911368 RepID=UPI001F014DE9